MSELGRARKEAEFPEAQEALDAIWNKHAFPNFELANLSQSVDDVVHWFSPSRL